MAIIRASDLGHETDRALKAASDTGPAEPLACSADAKEVIRVAALHARLRVLLDSIHAVDDQPCVDEVEVLGDLIHCAYHIGLVRGELYAPPMPSREEIEALTRHAAAHPGDAWCRRVTEAVEFCKKERSDRPESVVARMMRSASMLFD